MASTCAALAYWNGNSQHPDPKLKVRNKLSRESHYYPLLHTPKPTPPRPNHVLQAHVMFEDGVNDQHVWEAQGEGRRGLLPLYHWQNLYRTHCQVTLEKFGYFIE